MYKHRQAWLTKCSVTVIIASENLLSRTVRKYCDVTLKVTFIYSKSMNTAFYILYNVMYMYINFTHHVMSYVHVVIILCMIHGKKLIQ